MNPKDEKDKKRIAASVETPEVQAQVHASVSLVIQEESRQIGAEFMIDELHWHKALLARATYRLGLMFILAARDVDAKALEIENLKDRIAELEKAALPLGVSK